MDALDNSAFGQLLLGHPTNAHGAKGSVLGLYAT